ncbi:Hypothetical protein SRAE_X000207200 [Strongyloides ratti]|uniref:Uncharacterized protein n=1 Tax=Strongyloides ratti TaxID=34506 RepID=A0A090KYP4_STRRB|nr:Hypothetical protein SRAE_X000207200 [Strongyloides ratti]CEF60334.1 Hypothetical protein SRAE_X000207200 [Strongyloides ratti]
MLIITENENILERLRISLDIGDDKSLVEPEKFEADAAVFNLKKNLFNFCSTKIGYFILMGKDFSEQYQQLIVKCIHQVIVQSGKIKILILKTEVNPEDNGILKDIINKTKESWYSLWNLQLEKTLNLSESISKTERKGKLEKWLHLPNIDVALLSFDDPNLHKNICTFFNINPIGYINQIYTESLKDIDISNDNLFDGKKCDINNSHLTGHELPNKPPALNWTPFPRYSEVQISLKYKILKGCLTEDMFRFIISLAGKSYNWEYKYEWINGILLREDVIKVTIIRNDIDDDKFTFLEIAGRVDKDELDEDYLIPMKAIWPHLARVIKSTFTYFEKNDTIPYIMNLLLIGDIFFENDDANFKIEARSVDMVQSFTSIERLGKVAFRAHDRTWLLNLSQVFPDIHPICDTDLWKTRLMVFSNDNDKKDMKTKNELHSQNSLKQQKDTKILDESKLNNQNSTFLNVTSHKNRGRKVSFGGISSFPIDTNDNVIANDKTIDNNKNTSCNSEKNKIDKTNENKLNEYKNNYSIQNFVDDILLNVMKNVMDEKND